MSIVNLKKAINSCINYKRTCRVTEDSLTSENIHIRVKPISMLDNSQSHFVLDKHISRIRNLSSKEINDYDDISNLNKDLFILQVVESGDNKMSDVISNVDKRVDVFDEKVFEDRGEARVWINDSGYLN